MKFFKLIISFAVLVCALILSTPVQTNAASLYDYEFNDIALDKSWSIKFNLNLNPESVNPNNITFKDSLGLSVPFTTSYNNESKSIIVKPIGTYKVDTTYFLSIGTGVKSATDKYLKKTMNIKFKTVNSNDLLLEGVTSGESYIEFLEKEVARLKEYQKPYEQNLIVKETKNFILHFTEKAYKEGSYLVEESEKFAAEYEKFYGKDTLKDKVDIWIYDDSGIFKYMSNTYYSPYDDAIILPFSSLIEQGSNPTFVLAHEIMHAYQYHAYPNNKFGGDSGWFLEGQADYFPKQILGLPQYRHEPSGVVNWTKEFYLTEFNTRYGSNSWNGKRDWSRYKKITDLSLDRNDYFSFHSLVYFLEQQYGREKYKQFCDKIGNNTKPAEAFQTIYNKTEEQMMTEYKKFFQVTDE